MSAGIPVILIDFRGIPQSHHVNLDVISIMLRFILTKSVAIHLILIILPFGYIQYN